jgi:hypothetical protein
MSFFEMAQVVLFGGAAMAALIAVGAITISLRERAVPVRVDCREKSLIQHGERGDDC